MKPTITNAFTVATSPDDTHGSAPAANGSTSPAPAGSKPAARKARPKRGSSYPNQRNRVQGGSGASASSGKSIVPTTALACMQVDLRDTDFGTSLELAPMQAIDAVQALLRACPPSAQHLVSMEQTSWRDGAGELALSAIATRLGIAPVEIISPQQLVLDGDSLSALAAVCQPTRLLVVAVDGAIDVRDALAINRAIEKSRSPLTAELRALAALEVLGDRSVVLHARDRTVPMILVAENFRHYLAAVLDRPWVNFAAPQITHMRELLEITGALTVRPIETEVHSTSIDIGVNTSGERFTQPANIALIYDRPSNTWHTET